MKLQGLEKEYQVETGRRSRIFLAFKQSVRDRMYEALLEQEQVAGRLAQLEQTNKNMTLKWQHHILFNYYYLLSRMIFIAKVVSHNNTNMCVDEEGIWRVLMMRQTSMKQNIDNCAPRDKCS